MPVLTQLRGLCSHNRPKARRRPCRPLICGPLDSTNGSLLDLACARDPSTCSFGSHASKNLRSEVCLTSFLPLRYCTVSLRTGHNAWPRPNLGGSAPRNIYTLCTRIWVYARQRQSRLSVQIQSARCPGLILLKPLMSEGKFSCGADLELRSGTQSIFAFRK